MDYRNRNYYSAFASWVDQISTQQTSSTSDITADEMKTLKELADRLKTDGDIVQSNQVNSIVKDLVSEIFNVTISETGDVIDSANTDVVTEKELFDELSASVDTDGNVELRYKGDYVVTIPTAEGKFSTSDVEDDSEYSDVF